MVYFNQQHRVPLERTAEILDDLYDQSVSEGIIVAACSQMAARVEPVYQAIKAELIDTKGTTHFDETGARIEKKLWWLHVVCTSLLTYYAVHQNRGSKALDAIGIFPVFKGPAMHDAYRSYFQYQAVINALCNANHLRELIFIQEQIQQTWVSDMQKLLVEIKDAVSRAQPDRDGVPSVQIADFERCYDALCRGGITSQSIARTP